MNKKNPVKKKAKPMKRVALIPIYAAIVACYALNAMADLTSTPPVKIHFGPTQTVFVKPEAASQTLEMTKQKFMQLDFVLDAKTQERDGEIWCKRITGEHYKDIFRKRDVPLKKLESLKGASISELKGLLGEPVFVEGPMDFQGTVLYKWRTVNGGGDRMIALEAAAGIKGGSPTNVHFLLISVAKGN